RAGSGVPIVCVWRGCLSDAQFGSSLCSVHLQLKDFLDVKSAKARTPSEARRFLPPGSLDANKQQRRSSFRKKRSSSVVTNTTTSTSGGAASTKSGVSVIDMQHPGAESEVAVACSMSPLLAELFNGKLASTISLFCRRAVAESSGRQWRGVGGGGGG
ncbi:unnamed protein product, partial [Sphacelaria rigidula]